MPDQAPLRKGQEVFIRRPIQIYANVIGPRDGESLDGTESYCVKLQPLKQYYRAEDLERSERPPLIPTSRSDFFGRAQEINQRITRRAYELFESSGFTHGHDLEDWSRAQSEILVNVPVEISETETELTIRADVPGVSEENLEIQVAPHSICITGQRRDGWERKERNPIYSERHTNNIFRVLDLPSQVDPERVDVTLGSGVLEIRVLKAAVEEKITGRAKAASA
jgi:HSP20 family protein